MITTDRVIKKIIFNFKLSMSIKDTNKINPNIAFRVFDLSPVINNDEKNINIAKKNINFPIFLFFNVFSKFPKFRNIKPLI